MKEIQAFIDMLLEWKEVSEPTANDFQTLVFLLEHRVGVRNDTKPDESLSMIRKRLQQLVKEEGLDEGLLVGGIVENINRQLENTYTSIAQQIIDDESTIQSFISDGHQEYADNHQERLNRVKTTEYIIKAEAEFEVWKKIVATNYTKRNIRLWGINRDLERSNKLNQMLQSIPQEVMELFQDVPLGILREKVPMHKLRTMSFEEARQLRDSLDD